MYICRLHCLKLKLICFSSHTIYIRKMYNFELLMLKKFIYGLLSYNQRSTLVALVILQHVIKRDL